MNNRQPKNVSSSLSIESIRQLDLLPVAFRDEVETSRVRGFWILSCSLLAIGLGHLVLTDLFRQESNRQFETMLREKAEPVLRIRDEARRYIDLRTTKKRWIEQVETARPDDGLLQTLAVVSMAIAPSASDVKVDSIDVSLSTELPTTLTDAANKDGAREIEVVTSPNFVIIARSDADFVTNMASDLSNSPRIEKVVVEQPTAGDEPLFKLLGVPRQTRILP